MGHPPRIPVWLPLDKPVVYFVTFCVQDRQPVLANPRVLMAVRLAVARLEHWWLYAAIVMPDHLHVLAAPADREMAVGNLSGALKRWIRQEVVGPTRLDNCRASAPLAVGGMATGAVALQNDPNIVRQAPLAASESATWEWQRGSFDRLLRTEESAQAKWEYMRENPVRAMLVPRWEDWPFSIGFRAPSVTGACPADREFL